MVGMVYYVSCRREINDVMHEAATELEDEASETHEFAADPC